MADKLALLRRYWGYDTFRPIQEDIIDSVIAGHDTIALLPTGGGKSLCYQLPALVAEGLCVVVSPLIALMKDQVQHLNDMHIKASLLASGMSQSEVSAVLNNCVSGTLKLLYVSPERLRQQQFIEHFKHSNVSLIAVDEAHCVSQWGYDFRPPYLQIAEIRKYHPQAPVIALTATATPAVVDDIERTLQMHDTRRFRSTFARPNLSYTVVYDTNRQGRLLDIVRQTEGSGIVYVRSRRRAQELADMLVGNGIAAACYHAGIEVRERDRRQQLWMQDKCRVMVATNAFGMGIDKPDVRFVVHADVPDSLEAYFQEAGRAGRDGCASEAVLLCGGTESARLKTDFAASFPPVKYVRNVYRALCNYYKIPLGSGADSRFDFEMERVCDYYNMHVREFYSACRFLEREGLIAMPDREEVSSTAFIPYSREDIYHFRVEHLRLGDMMQTLLRMYPGVASAAVNIDERRIAQHSGMTTADVVATLNEMQAMKAIEYHQRSRKPQLLFTSARVNENDIYLGEQNYEALKQMAWGRLQAVERYIANTTTCRSRQLLAYFGEEDSVCDCGVCDVCRNRNASAADTEARILATLADGVLPVRELQSLVDATGRVEVAPVLRDMIDRGVLRLDYRSMSVSKA